MLSHWQVGLVVTILTLIVTWPTILYVFRTDVFWLPTGDSLDIYITVWDTWYGNQVLSGQADRFFTDRIFFPEGVSLVSHPFFVAHILIVNALKTFLPLSNALGLAFILIIVATALSAYVYMSYLFKEVWLALFGAVVFGFSPQVLSHFNHPPFMFLATLPLCLYFFHRGAREKRWKFMIVAGLLVGLTSEINLYLYMCILMTLGLGICAFAVARWRDGSYWRLVAVLVLAIGVSSLWRLYPLIRDSQALGEVLEWSSGREQNHDFMSFLVSNNNRLTSTVFGFLVTKPENVIISKAAYLGIIPLALVCLGLLRGDTRRRMLPWVMVWALFLILSLGSILNVNGSAYPGFPLPKYYLNQLVPTVFQAFHETDHFIMGMILPHAVLASYGLKALHEMRPVAKRPIFVLLLIGIVAIEYHVPVEENLINNDQFAFLEWLKDEENADIRLINVPMGRHDAKRYNLYQALSGYPSAEGAISRTPSEAFEYIQASPILGAWRDDRPALCGFNSSDEYLSALDELVADGFTHVVYHRQQRDARFVARSFLGAKPAYRDEYVSIYRINDLRDHCPEYFIPKNLSEAHAAGALLLPSVIHERHGTIVGFQGDLPAVETHLRYLSQAMFDRKELVNISTGENGDVSVASSNDLFRDLDAFGVVHNAIWLVNNPMQTNLQQLDIFVNWFSKQYRFCRRYLEQDDTTIDLYVVHGVPCDAAEINGDVAVEYDNGIRLHNFDLDISSGQATFYSAWTTELEHTFSFSIQIINNQGERVLQYDNVVERQPVSLHRVDVSSLVGGEYTVFLIVYDFDTGQTEGGTVQSTQGRFERQLEVTKIKI